MVFHIKLLKFIIHKCCFCKVSPSNYLISETLNCTVNCFFFTLDWQDLSDFIIVENIGDRLLFEICQLNKHVHTSTRLTYILFVASWLENLSLESNDANNNTVKNLERQTLDLKLQPYVKSTSIISINHVIIAEKVFHILNSWIVGPNLSDPNVSVCFMKFEDRELANNLQCKIQNSISHKKILNDPEQYPLLVCLLRFLFLSLAKAGWFGVLF